MSSSSEPFASRYFFIEPSRLQLRSDSNSYLAQEILPARPKEDTILRWHWHRKPLLVRHSRKRTLDLRLEQSQARQQIPLQTNTPPAEHPGMGAPLEVVAS
jgi:hypothetical protein